MHYPTSDTKVANTYGGIAKNGLICVGVNIFMNLLSLS